MRAGQRQRTQFATRLNPPEAAAYVEAVIEEGNSPALLLALRQVAMAQGGVAALARRAKVTREAA